MHTALRLLAVVAGLALAVGAAEAGDYRYGYNGGLFYNFYASPDPGGRQAAQMYLSPRPTPPLVGHTYITYQPLMPHEFLYRHRRTYVRSHPCAGPTVTRVRWMWLPQIWH